MTLERRTNVVTETETEIQSEIGRTEMTNVLGMGSETDHALVLTIKVGSPLQTGMGHVVETTPAGRTTTSQAVPREATKNLLLVLVIVVAILDNRCMLTFRWEYKQITFVLSDIDTPGINKLRLQRQIKH